MKPPKKDKVKKYLVGGTVKGYTAPIEGKKKLRTDIGAYTGDYFKTLGNTAAGVLGMPDLVKDENMKTSFGKKANTITDQVAAGANQLGIAGLNYLAPGLGTAAGTAGASLNQLAGEDEAATQNTQKNLLGIQNTGIAANSLLGFSGISKDSKGILDLLNEEDQIEGEVKAKGGVLKNGNVLKGRTHKEGGIKAVVGKKPLEMENNEIVLTKGVYEDPKLRGIASAINVQAGGKPIEEVEDESYAQQGTVAKDDETYAQKLKRVKAEQKAKNIVTQKQENQKFIDELNAKKASADALEEIETLKKEVNLYKGRGLTDYAKKSQKKLDDLQAKYAPKKVEKAESFNMLQKPKTDTGVAASYAPKEFAKKEVKASTTPTSTPSKPKGITQPTKGIERKLKMQTCPVKSAQATMDTAMSNIAATEKQQTIDDAAKGQVIPAVQQTPIPPTPAQKKAFDWTQGIGMMQTGLGVSALLQDGTAPTYTPNEQLIADANALRKESDYGFNPLTMSSAKQDVELARRTQNKGIQNLTGGDAATQLQMQAAGAVNTNRAYTDLAKDSENYRLQKKQAQYGMDQGIAAEMKTAFDSNMNLFDKRQMAGAQLTQSGIGNMIGSQRYQTEQAAIDKRNALANNPTAGLSALTDADIETQFQTLSPIEKKKYGSSKLWYNTLSK